MYKTVYDLNQNELDELKQAYFDNLSNWFEPVEYPFESPYDIPNEIILEYYSEVSFVDDDFFCND